LFIILTSFPNQSLHHLRYKELSKVKLSALVVTTTVVGYAMAPGEFSLGVLAVSTL
jgi:heme O synthase-like polyprenyltransferase